MLTATKTGLARRLATTLGVTLCILSTAGVCPLMLMALELLFDPWDTADRFLPPAGTLARTFREVMLDAGPFGGVAVTCVSGLLLVRALRRSRWHPAIPCSFLLTHALLFLGFAGAVSLVNPNGPPGYGQTWPGMLAFTIVVATTLALQGWIARRAGRSTSPAWW